MKLKAGYVRVATDGPHSSMGLDSSERTVFPPLQVGGLLPAGGQILLWFTMRDVSFIFIKEFVFCTMEL
jgi:hypothetical protein